MINGCLDTKLERWAIWFLTDVREEYLDHNSHFKEFVDTLMYYVDLEFRTIISPNVFYFSVTVLLCRGSSCS
jgi:hypothetical protein